MVVFFFFFPLSFFCGGVGSGFGRANREEEDKGCGKCLLSLSCGRGGERSKLDS